MIPNNIIKMFKGQNPKQLAINMAKQNSNPMIANLMKMANEGKIVKSVLDRFNLIKDYFVNECSIKI